MKLDVEFEGARRPVEVAREGQRLHFAIDGRDIKADAIEVAPQVYSILIDGAGFEARVEETSNGLRVSIGQMEYLITVRDPRKRSPIRGSALEAARTQRVVAPMPGRVVRILVKAGDRVEAGQGIAVVEAMKMQNEVRSAKSGVVERLLVSENQSVSAGEPLAVIS